MLNFFFSSSVGNFWVHNVSFCKCCRTHSGVVPGHVKACTPFAPAHPIVQTGVWLTLSGISSSSTNLQSVFRVLCPALGIDWNFYFRVPCLSPCIDGCDSAKYLSVCFSLSFAGNMGKWLQKRWPNAASSAWA